MMETYTAPPEIGRIQQRSLIIGVVGIVLLLIGALLVAEPAQFFRSYLIGYIFWMGIALGCLAICMLQHLSGGAWGLVIRRLLESATRTLPLMALLFLPLILGAYKYGLYPWAVAEKVSSSKLLQHKAEYYLNMPFFLGRAVFYFGVWIGLTYFLNKWSREQDASSDPQITRRLQVLSGPGLVLYGLTVTFASIDWVMSLEPEWFSTIFGILFMGGQGVSAMAFVIAMAVLLAKREPMSRVFAPNHFHDLGKLLLAFVMLWAYFNFSQFLIIWAGNLPEEIPWYLHRLRGGWQWFGLALVVFHFALPFLLLLSRDLKRSARKLVGIAVLVIVMRFVDLFWMIAPEFSHGGFHIHWMDIIAPIGVGGLWLAAFMWQLKGRPLLPLRDPHLQDALEPAAH
jgi:hypothetical protein